MCQHHVVAAIQNLLQHITNGHDELATLVSARALFDLKQCAEAARALAIEEAAGANSSAVGAAVASLARQSLVLATEASLSSVIVCGVVCDGLAAAAALLQPLNSSDVPTLPEAKACVAGLLEPLGEAVDTFAIEIFAGVLRLEELLRPQWVQEGSGRGGFVVFKPHPVAGCSAVQELQYFARELQHYQALQGVCFWSLALAARIAGNGHFTSALLWDYASGGPLGVQIFAKGVLCIQEEGLVKLPEDLAEIREAIMRAILGLTSQDLAFEKCLNPEDGSIGIEERNATLQGHCARLAAGAELSGLLECILAYPWALRDSSASLLPSLVAFLAALATAEAAKPHHLTGQLTAWRGRLESSSAELWSLLVSLSQRAKLVSRGFLRDCATLAFIALPSSEHCSEFIKACLTCDRPGALDSFYADPLAVAALVAFVINVGCSPGSDELTQALLRCEVQTRIDIAAHLKTWRTPLRREACLLSLWTQVLNLPAEAPDAGTCTMPTQTATEPCNNLAGCPRGVLAGPALDLRELVCDAPREFCCQLDGRLLVDPVRSPYGNVFERSMLGHRLDASGGRCPITGSPLQLSECNRDNELRLRICQWVRQSQPRRRFQRAQAS
mmetsp:Transcript_12329/g.33869  ORF Transcript_12329/g.33869 Transcript_12329/m.33869 type:complete len:615 (-) Transcript_12329:131-1975(-)